MSDDFGVGSIDIWQTALCAKSLSAKFDAFKFYNTLTGLVRSLVNQYTVIDLRNESYVTGKLVAVDGAMNVEMVDVTLHDPRGRKHVFESFFVHGRNIRYVHIPKKMNALEQIEIQLNSMGPKKNKKAAHTFKKVRAERKQKETISSIYEQRKMDKLP